MRTLTYKAALMALGLAAVCAAPTAVAQTSTWSVDSGPSLFQTLGINVPAGPARSQVLPRFYADLTVITHNTKAAAKTQINESAAPLSPIPASAAAPLSPSEMQIQTAGTQSVLAPSLQFTPLNARDDAKAVPITQMAQIAGTEAADDTVQILSSRVSSWRVILGRYVVKNGDGLVLFDYAALSAMSDDMALLDDYIQAQTGRTPSTMSRNEAMAYWANLYNALTVQVVAQNYPVGSIREIKSGVRKGPWKRKLVTVEGRTLSLDDIEHGIMRPTFETPLVHYMVNCASVGCPNLKITPWSADTLDADLDAAARAYINSTRGVKISNGKVQASSIYKWFKKDFGGNDKGVLAHLIKYADPELADQLQGRVKIDKYAYDWGVNTP